MSKALQNMGACAKRNGRKDATNINLRPDCKPNSHERSQPLNLHMPRGQSPQGSGAK